jgi:branched-chain amino acid transport system ATP-binding protein
VTLEVSNLFVSYGAAPAVQDVSLQVPHGVITTIIGSNGAGKSTVMKAIVGLVQPAAGSIRFGDTTLTGLHPSQIVAHGVALVPEGRRLFASMSVSENLAAGAYSRDDQAAVAADRERVLSMFPVLGERLSLRAGSLSGGQQQMLAVGRALMSRPKLLLLDEPSIGLAPVVVQQIAEIVRTVSREGVDILLVEQNASLALRIAERAYVLENGRIVSSGSAAELREDPAVQAAYLGF